MGFPKEVKERALIACKRYCVLCESYKGINVECHHIIPHASGGDDTFDNCIPLCFDCHAMVGSYNPKHPKGNKFSPEELKDRRDSFYERVEDGELPRNTDVSEGKDEDREIYSEIKNIFKSPNLKYYLTEVDLGNDFDNSIFYPLNRILDMEDDPEYEFVDSEIENYKRELFSAVNNFLGYKAINTFPTDIGTHAIRTWKNDDFTYQERVHINQEFNDLATGVWDAYKAFVSICKKRLSK